MKAIQLKLPDRLSHGYGGSFKKGIVDALLDENAITELSHTPAGHDDTREEGREFGKNLAAEIAKIVD